MRPTSDDEYRRVECEDPAPSYEESVQSQTVSYRTTVAKKDMTTSPSLATRLAEVQRSRVEATMNEHVIPFMHEHIESGLSKATFALILSDLSDCWQVTDDAIIGEMDPGYVRVVRLQGDGNSSKFWEQPQVQQQLDQSLRTKLGLGDRKFTIESASSPLSPQSPLAQMTIKKSWFGRDSRKNVLRPRSQMFSQGSAGWREPEKSTSELEVCVEEIKVRATTSMGLYHTTTCTAVLIKINIGH